MTKVGTSGKTAIERNRGIRTWIVDGHLATTSSAGDDHLARRTNKGWSNPENNYQLEMSGGLHLTRKAAMFRPRCKSMKGEVILESLDQRSSSRSVSLILSVSVSVLSGSVSQSLALTLTLILTLARTLADAAAPAPALTLVLLLTGLSFWYWL